MADQQPDLDQATPNRVWVEIGIAGVLGLLVHYLTPGMFLFLVPLQMLQVRRGSRALGYGIVLLAAAALLIELATAGSRLDMPDGERFMRWMVLFLHAMLLGGLWLLNEPRAMPYRGLMRALAATGITGLVSIPFISSLIADPDFASSMRNLLLENPFTAPLFMTDGSNGAGIGVVDQRVGLLGQQLLRSFLLLYLVYLFSGVWVGNRLGAYTLGARPPGRRLARFVMEPWMIWPLLLGGAVVLADALLGDLQILGYAAWNTLLVMLFLYALQGIGILQTLYTRYNVPGPFRVMVGFALFFMLTKDGLNLVPVIGLPGLGISEIWVDYKRTAAGEPPSETG